MTKRKMDPEDIREQLVGFLTNYLDDLGPEGLVKEYRILIGEEPEWDDDDEDSND